MTGPFERIPAAHRGNLARGATIAALTLFGLVTILGMSLRNEVAELGIVSLQLAGSPEVAAQVLASWADVPRSRLLWAHGLDLILPVAYALAFGSIATLLAHTSRQAASAATVAAAGAIVAAVADQVENLAMWVTILIGPGWHSVLPTLAAATVKFSAFTLAIGALIVAFARSRSNVGRSVA
jgi:hypothetical protein